MIITIKISRTIKVRINKINIKVLLRTLIGYNFHLSLLKDRIIITTITKIRCSLFFSKTIIKIIKAIKINLDRIIINSK